MNRIRINNATFRGMFGLNEFDSIGYDETVVLECCVGGILTSLRMESLNFGNSVITELED